MLAALGSARAQSLSNKKIMSEIDKKQSIKESRAQNIEGMIP